MSDLLVFLVTGAGGAIGQAIARRLAQDTSHAVVLVGRTESKLRQAVGSIKEATQNANVRYELADLSRCDSARSLAERWDEPLHVLINNAGVTPTGREETPDGIERLFATNVLGYFWMIKAFTERLAANAPARIVNVASNYAGDLALDDLEFERRPYNNHTAYRQSKQANRMLTVAFAERLQSDGITVNACHPGVVSSKLSGNLGTRGSQSPDDGAETPVWLATNPVGQEMTGKYFDRKQPVRDRFATDKEAIDALFEACRAYNRFC